MGRHQQAIFSALKNLAMPGEFEMLAQIKGLVFIMVFYNLDQNLFRQVKIRCEIDGF